MNTSFGERDPEANFTPRFEGTLGKPIFVQTSFGALKPWLIDVILDQAVDAFQVVQAQSLEAAHALAAPRVAFLRTYQNINLILNAILNRTDARLVRTTRDARDRRLAIAYGDSISIPSLDNLSAGQSSLLSIFATIVRYGDSGSAGKLLGEVDGIVLVDEIDAHLHADLQFEALPRLMKLFPKIQFIVTAHSPLFPLGLEAKFGADAISIVEMPEGATIDAEIYSEFARSLEVFRATRAFERSVQEKVGHEEKALILSEGETDPRYLRTAAELLGLDDLLDLAEFDWVGTPANGGALGGGKSHLNDALKFLKNNPRFLGRRVVLLYDSDANKPAEDIEGRLFVRCLPPNEANEIRKRGIENLLNPVVFATQFYKEETTEISGGDTKTLRSLDKSALCLHLCEVARDATSFAAFQEPLIALRDLLLGTPAAAAAAESLTEV